MLTTSIDVAGSYRKERGCIGSTCWISGLFLLVGDDLACLEKTRAKVLENMVFHSFCRK